MKSKFTFRIAKWVDNINCRYADHIVTIGYEMQETLLKRFANREVTKSSVIYNWANEEEIVPVSDDHFRVKAFREQYGLQDKFVVMYSGNIGLYYDLENLISIAKHFHDRKDMVFAFVGEGAVKSIIQDYVRENQLDNVHFIPYQKFEDLKYSLNAADVHLVVNQKGIKGVSVPSKIYGVMAAGRPVLGVLESGSEAHRLITESGCGEVSEPQQYNDVINKLDVLYSMDREELQACGLRGRSYLEQHLRKNTSLDKYLVLLKSFQFQQ